MSDKFVLPIGIDGEKIIAPLNAGIDTLEKMQASSRDTGKALNDAFTQGGAAIDKIDDKLKPISKDLNAIKALGKQVGKEMADAFSDRNIDPSKIERAIDNFKEKLTSIQTVAINVDIDPSKLALFEKQLDQATEGVDILRIAAAQTQEVLNSLDPTSPEYQQAAQNLEFLDTAMEEFANTAGKTVEKQKSLKTQLREMKADLAAMELAGQAGSKGYKTLLKSAGELEDQIGDTNAQIKAMASDTQTFDALISGAQGLTGAFAATQGVVGLLGTENEDLEKALLKVNSAMAILQGLQAVAETLNKDSALSVLFLSKARQTETAATVSQAAATSAQAAAEAASTAATTASIIATEALVAAEAQEAAASLAAAAASEAHALANTQETAAALAAALSAEAEAVALRQTAAATAAAATSAQANAAANVLQTGAMAGATLGTKALKIGLASIGIGLIIALVAYLVANWDKLKASMEKLLPATKDLGKGWDTLKAIFVGVGTALVEFVIAPFKIAFALITEGLGAAVDQAKESYNVVENYNKGHLQQMKTNAANNALELKKIRLAQWESALKIEEAEGKDTYKSREKLYKNKIAIAKKEGQETKDLEQELAEFQAQKRGENAKAAQDAAKKAAEIAKKAAEDAIKKREEDAKKRAEFEKQQNELILKYTREINALSIESLEESLEKERAKIKDAAKNKIDDLKKDEAKTKEAVEKRAQLIKAIEEDAANSIKEIEARAAKEKLQLRIEGQDMLLKLQGESLDNSLEISKLNHEKTLANIEEQFKNETDLKTQLLIAENAAFAREQDKIRLEDKQKTIDLEEEKAILIVELMERGGKQSEKTEKQKQLAILGIKLEAAQKSLAILEATSTTENEIEILRAKKLVKDIKDAIDVEAKNGKKFDFLEMLGIDDKDGKLKGAINQSMQVLGDFTSFMVDQYDQQISKKQEQIDQTAGEIDDLEARLEKEQELKDQGFANDVELIQAELDAKKEQQAEQIRQEQELLEKKKQMQKVQLALDAVSQLSGLITASVSIFEGFAKIPVVGIPLAVAMIGTMFGTFAASKIKAAQAISQQTVSYSEGGEIDGNSHLSGGVKYYSKDGKKVRELEGGEYVTKKFSYKKYKKLVSALNEDDFRGLSIQDIAAMGIFDRLGGSYIPDSMLDAVDDSHAIKNFSIGARSSGNDLGNIDKNVAYLAAAKKEELPVEDADFYYRKKGTRITKTRKK